MMKGIFIVASLVAGLALPAWPEERALPLNPFRLEDALIGQEAPELEISEWLNGKATTLKGLRGHGVVLEFFQMWCPGCNRFSIPLMREWTEMFADEKDLSFISVHTVFEGHSYQSPQKLKKFLKKKGIKHLVGIDRHSGNDSVPVTMRRYRTGGTPAIAILDKKGVVRFKYFGAFRKEPVTDLIRKLMKEEIK